MVFDVDLRIERDEPGMARVFRWFFIEILIILTGGFVVALFMDDDERTAIALAVAGCLYDLSEFGDVR